MSSLSRRLFVGAKICEKYLITDCDLNPTRDKDYPKNGEGRQ
jgi:hypothetical protein